MHILTQLEDVAGVEAYAPEVLIGDAMARLRLQVARLAPHFRMALITGERGSGVETVARRMHELSPAADAPFIRISAQAFAEGAPVGSAGVLFLAGLDEVEIGLQAELLRRVAAADCRVIGASQCDLRGMVASGRMRAEVYARVGMLELRVPPLREREVGEIATATLARLGHGAQLSPQAVEQMQAYGWPGNLAELWVLCRDLRGLVDDLPLTSVSVAEQVTRLDQVIERHVVEVLQRCTGNKLRAAELLGISRSTLYRMLESAAV